MPSGPILDSPDLEVRRIMLKRQQGHALTSRENQRLASRMQAEDQTGKEGGAVTQALPRQQDPNVARQQGAASVRQLFSPSSLTPNAPTPNPTGLTQAIPNTRPGAISRATASGFVDAAGNPVGAAPGGTPTTSAAQQTESADPLTGTNNQVPGGATVPVAPPPSTGLTRAGPAPAPGHGGIDVNSYVGSRYASPTLPSGDDNPAAAISKPGYQPPETSEQGADQALRQRFGAPPNERGAVDVSTGGPTTSAPAPDNANFGGIGKYRQQFSNPTSAAIYDGYVKKLFSQDAGNSPSQPQTPMTPVRRTPPTTGSKQPSDDTEY